MKLIPAIDLKNNKCVRLSKGKEETSIIYNENPVKQAKFFEKEGCDRIHIVDLDAAFGRREINKNTILKIRKETSVNIELGSEVYDSEGDISRIVWSKIINHKREYIGEGSESIQAEEKSVGTYQYIVEVFDDMGNSALDSMIVKVEEEENLTPPISMSRVMFMRLTTTYTQDAPHD